MTIRSQFSASLARGRKWVWRYQHSSVVRRQLVVRLGTLSALSAVVLMGLVGLSAGRQAQNQWGETQPVFRFIDDLYAGDVVDPHAVEHVEVPLHLIPPGALSTIPPRSRLVARVGRGEFVTAQRLHLGDNGSLSHLVPGDHSLVTITFPVRSAVLHPGDVVSLFDTSSLANSVWGPELYGDSPNTTDHTDLTDRTEPTDRTPTQGVPDTAQLVASSLAVVHVDSEHAQVLVSVPNDDLPAITAVIARGQFSVALAGSATPVCVAPERC